MSEDTTMTMAEFIQREGLTMKAAEVGSRPDSLMDSPGARHWRCVLESWVPAPFGGGLVERTGRKMVIFFTQGSAHTEAPTLADVLDCMASDSTFSGDFADFCSELGYDEDSRQAERIFKATKRQTAKLLDLFGETADYCPVLDDLRYNVERL